MAEQLGQAVLELTANTAPLERALNKVRSDLESFKAGKIKLTLDTGGAGGLSTVQTGLRNISTETDRATEKTRSLKQLINSFAGGSYSKLSAQISQLTKESIKLQLVSDDYLKTLTRIKELEGIRAIKAGRQSVAATAAAYAPDGALGQLDYSQLPQLPNTLAGDQQRISELTLKLQNVAKGTTDYKLALKQLAQAQREVTDNNRELSNSLSQTLTGFGKASQENFATGAGDKAAVDKAIRRNKDKVAKQEARESRQRAALEEDLAQQISKREQSEERIKKAAEERIETIGRELAASQQLTREKQKQAAADQKAQAASRRERNQKIQGAVGNAIIGGAFPALFGQGIGASIGGGLGGLIGGAVGGNFGFGLSLVGTAIGQSVDNLATALENPIQNFDLLKQSAVLSSKSLEKLIEGLIATGRESEAAAVIQKDLAKTYGTQNLRDIEELRKKNDDLARSWARLTTAIGALAAGPVARLAEIFSGLAGGGTGDASRVSDSQFTEELKRIERDFGRGAASDVARFKFFSPQVTPKPGEPLGQTVQRQNKAALDYAVKQGYITKEVAAAKAEELAIEQKILSARALTNKEYSNSFRLISAQVQGNRTAQLDERANAAIDNRNRTLRQLDAAKVAPNDARREEANKAAALELFRIEEERLQLQKEIASTIAQEAIKRQQIAQQIAATTARRDAALAAGDAAASPGNSFLAARAGQLEGASFLAQNRLRVEQAITRERELQAQLANESDPTKRAQIGEQLTTAAQEIRAAGIEAGAALAEKAAGAAQSLRGAQDSLRSTLQGNFKFLPGAQRQSLLDSARADIERGKASGILRPNFGATGRRRTFEAADFVRNVENQQAQVAQQQALVDALKENTNAERNIRINVTMNADGSANVYQTEQQAALL